MTNYKGELIKTLSNTVPVITDGEITRVIDSTKLLKTGCIKSDHTHSTGLYTLSDIISSSAVMTNVKERILTVSSTQSNVLIYGETGTGKELVAQSIHAEGPRASEPFISHNCAAIPDNLLEGLFFGMEKWSYTGAVTQKGLFELANGGTLFLDEINSMSLAMQAKLLKVLEKKGAQTWCRT